MFVCQIRYLTGPRILTLSLYQRAPWLCIHIINWNINLVSFFNFLPWKSIFQVKVWNWNSFIQTNGSLWVTGLQRQKLIDVGTFFPLTLCCHFLVFSSPFSLSLYMFFLILSSYLISLPSLHFGSSSFFLLHILLFSL